MQVLDLEQYPNTSGWQVVHLMDDQMYEIQNKHGTPLRIGRFTSRRFAEIELDKYLTALNKSQDVIKEAKKRTKKEVNSGDSEVKITSK